MVYTKNGISLEYVKVDNHPIVNVDYSVVRIYLIYHLKSIARECANFFIFLRFPSVFVHNFKILCQFLGKHYINRNQLRGWGVSQITTLLKGALKGVLEGYLIR